MTKKIDERIAYWENNYVSYWKDRVSSASENKLVKKDILPPDIKIFRKYYKKALTYLRNDSSRMLDVGIGFGRSVPLYQDYFKNNIWGSDISQGMIEECKKSYPHIANQVVAASAEKQPFKNNFVDLIVCWATFDATYQEKVLWEFQRLLDINGVVLVTGKNNNYCLNDKKALAAEIGARNKNHPNYFTDIKILRENIEDFGFVIKELICFKRRGDFAKDNYSKKDSQKFYEYVLILQKIKDTEEKNLKFKIADEFSQSFKNKYVQK
ncbi:MAG: class I SAM-dependent methyltransferase [Candidatus Daviesbacteria bacterium]|nr:class I SAM-dependent methyltransferase [Candidatus Daviesbacteria bacterium]